MDHKLIQDLLESNGYILSKLDQKVSYHGGVMFAVEGWYPPAKPKESINNMTKLNTQSIAISAIKGSNFIVGSVDATGQFSIAGNPMAQYDAASARAECKRLAKLTPGKLYFFTQFRGAEMVPTTPVVSI